MASAGVSKQMNTLHFNKSHNSSPNLKGVANGNASSSLSSSSSSSNNIAATAVGIVLPQIQTQPIFATSSSSSSSGRQQLLHQKPQPQFYENGDLLGQADIIEREYQREQQQHHASKSGRGKYNQVSATATTTSSTSGNSSNQTQQKKRKLETGKSYFLGF